MPPTIDSIAALHQRRTGERDAIASRVVDTTARLTAATMELEATTAARELLQSLAESRRELIRTRVERIVALAVSGVFGDRVTFRLEAETKRGSLSVVPMIGYRGKRSVQWRECASGVGGGVVDVVSFAMRASVVAMTPSARPVIIADEPFKHLSDRYLPRVAEMVKTLAETTGIQFIIVSHESAIADAADRIFRCESTGGVSRIEVEP